MEKLYAGLDIGGQTIKGIVLDGAGKTRHEVSRTTPASRGTITSRETAASGGAIVPGGAAAVLDVIRGVMAELSAVGTIASVGVGTPGGVDRDGVIVGMSANISGWYGTKLREEISAMAAAPCAVRNDGNMAAYGEWAAREGSPKGMLFIGLGTGIGGGYVEDGRIFGGCDDRALEIGHCVIEPSGRRCACGIDGCAEAYASGPSIGKVAAALGRGEDAGLGSMARAAGPASSFKDSPLAARALAGECFNAREVYEAYAAGDRLALAADAVAAEALARAVSAALAMLAPDTVVFGGGVVAGAPHLPARIAELVREKVYRDAWKQCEFETALLSHRAGLLGAALYGASLVVNRSDLLRIRAR